MEVEAKLDEEFLFHLGFANAALRGVTDREIYHKYRLWLYQLCGEQCEGIQMKRRRNLHLKQLLIGMQNGVLEGPFAGPPQQVELLDATEMFAPIQPDFTLWLNHEYEDGSERGTQSSKCGRSSHTLPAAPQNTPAYPHPPATPEPQPWLDRGDGAYERDKFSSHPPAFREPEAVSQKSPVFQELEKVLAQRKDPWQRESVLTFYDALLGRISAKLEERNGEEEDEIVEGLLAQLEHDLVAKGQYAAYEALDHEDRRRELLAALRDRVEARRDKVVRREQILDEIEHHIDKSSFDLLDDPKDKYRLPTSMWKQAVDAVPSRKDMERLLKAYPAVLVRKFFESLSSHKREIAWRMHRKYENICTGMKKELSKEGERKRRRAEEAEQATTNAFEVLRAVREQQNKLLASERSNTRPNRHPHTFHSQAYEELTAAISDEEKVVADEWRLSKELAAEIDALNHQTKLIKSANADMIQMAEEINLQIMRNIGKLKEAVREYEKGIEDIWGGMRVHPKSMSLRRNFWQ